MGWEDFPLTVIGNGSTIEDFNEDLILNITGIRVDFYYNGSTWHVVTNVGQEGGLVISGLTVSHTDTSNTVSNVIQNVNIMRFDTDSGFDIVEIGEGEVRVGMNSTFKFINVANNEQLVATGLDTLELIAGSGITITTDANSEPQSITFSSTGGGGGSTTITNDNSTNALRYLTFVNVTSGSADGFSVSSDKLLFNPSDGNLAATEFSALSDLNAKDVVGSIQNSEDILKSIETIEFTWKETGIKSYGVIAQQLETILPELVVQNDSKKYVNYTPLIPILIDAYKKIIERIEKLENK